MYPYYVCRISNNLAKRLYIKSSTIFVGTPFKEMEEDRVLDQLNCKVVYSSSAFTRALSEKPRIVIINCFLEQEKNDALVQEIISKSPHSKIVVIGRRADEFKRTLSEGISTYLGSDVSFNGLKIAIDQLTFDFQYGEGYQDVDIVLGGNSSASQSVWIILIVTIVVLIGMIYYYF